MGATPADLLPFLDHLEHQVLVHLIPFSAKNLLQELTAIFVHIYSKSFLRMKHTQLICVITIHTGTMLWAVIWPEYAYFLSKVYQRECSQYEVDLYLLKSISIRISSVEFKFVIMKQSSFVIMCSDLISDFEDGMCVWVAAMRS